MAGTELERSEDFPRNSRTPQILFSSSPGGFCWLMARGRLPGLNGVGLALSAGGRRWWRLTHETGHSRGRFRRLHF